MDLIMFRLSGRLPFTENTPSETEARIQAAKFDLSKLYQNVSQSASLFLKKILCSYPWCVQNRFFSPKITYVSFTLKEIVTTDLHLCACVCCYIPGHVPPSKTASATLGCRMPIWCGSGGRHSPSPPRVSRSLLASSSRSGLRWLPSTKYSCAPILPKLPPHPPRPPHPPLLSLSELALFFLWSNVTQGKRISERKDREARARDGLRPCWALARSHECVCICVNT